MFSCVYLYGYIYPDFYPFALTSHHIVLQDPNYIMKSTTALVLKEISGPFSLEQISVDNIRHDEALIEIHATGLCHTDLSCANGTLPASAPAVLGHEGKSWLKTDI